jgi:hypothetical protein
MPVVSNWDRRLADVIHVEMVKCGIDSPALAVAAECGTNTIDRILGGVQPHWKVHQLVKICYALMITPDDLFVRAGMLPADRRSPGSNINLVYVGGKKNPQNWGTSSPKTPPKKPTPKKGKKP